eukprot:Skav208530  [mRNA]  locus=scaffold3037:41922:45343:+ [translate_table: standard]
MPHPWDLPGSPPAAEAKPATLIRSRLAKYCSKDTAVLSFLGDVLEARKETLQMQMENRALMTFFVAIWLDTIALSVGNDLVQVAIQSILKLLSQPAQQDAFYAGVTVTGALCAKIQLEESVQGQLLVRLAKQVVGADGRTAFSLMAEMSQLQELRRIPGGVVKVLAKHGPEVLLMGCHNCSAGMVSLANSVPTCSLVQRWLQPKKKYAVNRDGTACILKEPKNQEEAIVHLFV